MAIDKKRNEEILDQGINVIGSIFKFFIYVIIFLFLVGFWGLIGFIIFILILVFSIIRENHKEKVSEMQQLKKEIRRLRKDVANNKKKD